MAGESAFLLHLVAGDKPTAREILSSFLESDRTDRARLAEAVERKSPDEIYLHAHRIKGASRAIGALSYAALASDIEMGATTGADLGPMLAALEAAGAEFRLWERQLS
jgi:two-component system sensor histidine kinase EvgS